MENDGVKKCGGSVNDKKIEFIPMPKAEERGSFFVKTAVPE